MRVWQEEPSVVIEDACERVVGGSAPLIVLLLAGADQMPSVACYLRALEARRLAGELLAGGAAVEELS